ncbi:MAG: hypothetical protein H6925_03255 [Holosporaceae bacterium]|nr:MAG: hypothetical protein H6925_03255 [Holosporaceae bacterium]
MKILLYELNEVPWQVVDYFTKTCPGSAIEEILQHSHQYTTVTQDSGELHPWSTWPTVHRGVHNDIHNIRFLNQDLPKKYPPIWEILTDNNVSVGLFGSLQSWPVPTDKTQYRFYVPDTFARTAETYPDSLKGFQKFNLTQTKKDGGKTPGKIKMSWSLFKDILLFFELGFSLKTAGQLFTQLLKETFNPAYRHIRSMFQAPLAFDFYIELLKNTRPEFSSFFTNHAAGMMHRYWKYTFPEEFNYTLEGDDAHFKAQNILRAMKIADQQIGTLKEFADKNGYTLMIASSMGQEAIDRGDYPGEIRIADVDRFCEGLGYTGKVKNNLAMQPDYAFSFRTEKDLEDFKERVKGLLTPDGEPLFTLKESGLTLNCNLQITQETIEKGFVYKDSLPLSLDTFGLQTMNRDPGTAYHQPRGIFIVYKKGMRPLPYREKIDSTQVAPTILHLFGIKKMPYMKSPLKINEILNDL